METFQNIFEKIRVNDLLYETGKSHSPVNIYDPSDRQLRVYGRFFRQTAGPGTIYEIRIDVGVSQLKRHYFFREVELSTPYKGRVARFKARLLAVFGSRAFITQPKSLEWVERRRIKRVNLPKMSPVKCYFRSDEDFFIKNLDFDGNFFGMWSPVICDVSTSGIALLVQPIKSEFNPRVGQTFKNVMLSWKKGETVSINLGLELQSVVITETKSYSSTIAQTAQILRSARLGFQFIDLEKESREKLKDLTKMLEEKAKKDEERAAKRKNKTARSTPAVKPTVDPKANAMATPSVEAKAASTPMVANEKPAEAKEGVKAAKPVKLSFQKLGEHVAEILQSPAQKAKAKEKAEGNGDKPKGES